MHSNPYRRFFQRGNSFGTCLLTMVLVFGGIGFYYFNYFQWRHFENPYEGLTYVKETTPPQKNAFRKKTISSICDPIRQQIDRVVKLRKSTKKGTVNPPELEQELTEVRNRLKEIMTEARLRRIPKEFEKNYKKNLSSLQALFQSVNALEDSFGQETDEGRKKLYKESIKKSNKAKKDVMQSRTYFTGDGWKQDSQ
jgi:lysyl-tRNA synthetase class I